MSTLNDELTRQVFKAMALHRPQLAALADLGDDEGEVDIRLLGDQIIRNFPWPIGIEVRRLLSGSMREPDRRRLDQLFRTFERSVQFLAFVMIIQLWRARRERSFPLPASFSNEFERRAPMVSLGNLTWMVRQIARAWKTSGSKWFIPEIEALVTDRFCDELDRWVPERNAMGHYQINLTAEEVQRRCVMANERIIPILAKLSFFAKYKLISVRDPGSALPGLRPAVFDPNATPSPGDEQDRAQALRTRGGNAVLLIKVAKNQEEYIDLSPLLIDTHGEPSISNGEKVLHKDVFLFSKFRNGHIFYSGAEATERTDLSSLSDYRALVAGFEDLLTTLGTTT